MSDNLPPVEQIPVLVVPEDSNGEQDRSGQATTDGYSPTVSSCLFHAPLSAAVVADKDETPVRGPPQVQGGRCAKTHA